jgi:hypothetical protein
MPSHNVAAIPINITASKRRSGCQRDEIGEGAANECGMPSTNMAYNTII